MVQNAKNEQHIQFKRTEGGDQVLMLIILSKAGPLEANLVIFGLRPLIFA